MSDPNVHVTKRCSKCGEIKPATREYFHAQSRMRHGLHSHCKPCSLARQEVRRRRLGVRQAVKRSLAQRFWERVDQRSAAECWAWTGARYNTGYGQLWSGTRSVGAHRVSWELHYGKVPAGHGVFHRCDNRPCVNPSHLFVGPQLANMRDKVSKDRQARGETDGNSRYTANMVREVRARYASGMTQREAGEPFGMKQAVVSDIVRRRTWRHI